MHIYLLICLIMYVFSVIYFRQLLDSPSVCGAKLRGSRVMNLHCNRRSPHR